MDLIKIKISALQKMLLRSEKKKPWLEENTHKSYIWQWLGLGIYNKLKIQQTKQSNKKWAKNLNRHITKKDKWIVIKYIKRY